nr:hypothetical protein [Tanacetum cinerariifolium]
MMDWYMKNVLGLYWKRGDDEEVFTHDELSNLEEHNIYEWNKDVSWVEEKPWLDDGTWKEPNDDICHEYKPIKFKSGHIEWPTCYSNENGYCNGENLSRMVRVGNMTYFQNYEWYEGLKDGDLNNEVLKEKSHLGRIMGT